MFIGGKRAILQAAPLWRTVMDDYIKDGIVDDDEGTAISLALRYPDIAHFERVGKNWDDCLRRFLANGS